MDLLSIINIKLAALTIIGQVFITMAILYWVFGRKKYPAMQIFFARYGLLLAFITALAATVSSLFYSEVVGFEPCNLCWFQRIFMYPLVIILGLALFRKDLRAVTYGLVLSGIGFLITLYHNYIYYMNQGLAANCDFGGTSVSCIKRYVFEFGYITIPLMSLTAFALIIIFLLFVRKNIQKGAL